MRYLRHFELLNLCGKVEHQLDASPTRDAARECVLIYQLRYIYGRLQSAIKIDGQY